MPFKAGSVVDRGYSTAKIITITVMAL